MIKVIKRSLPKPVKKILIKIKQRAYDDVRKIILYKKMRSKHSKLLKELREKNKIKVVFLAIHKSVWKVDPVFKKMLADPFFEPLVLVCPYLAFGEERMRQDLVDTYDYFKRKGYPTMMSYLEEEERWITLKELCADIIFFTNPHKITRHEYYEDAYQNHLSCYVPYAHDVSKYDDYAAQYNQSFHNAIWKIFAPHDEDLLIFKRFSRAKGRNVYVTGYPACEDLFRSPKGNPWNPQEKDKKKIIWAPHHTINDENLQLSTFLEYSAIFQKIAVDFRESVQFAFKPHPMLKSKLYKLSGWGKEKTDVYYEFWANNSNTQLELGEYADLFLWSDGMIHDSGSFLAEYHYVKKPVLYMCSKSVEKFLNPFGQKALYSCNLGFGMDDIIGFIESILHDTADYNDEFYRLKIEPYFCGELPSDRIMNSLENALKDGER